MLQKKDMDNVEIANLLRDVAAAYQIEDEDKNKFRIIAYERAADAVEHLSSEAKDLYDEGKLEDIPGVGASISENLSEIFKTGKSKHFETLLKNISPAVFDLIPLEGIGPKMAYKLVNQLKIKPPDAIVKLKKLAKRGEIAKLEGFGEDSQKSILKAIDDYKGKNNRHLLNYAESVAELIVDWMKKDKNIKRIDTLGSLRRKVSTIGDIDIACATTEAKDTIEHFIQYPDVKRVLDKGDKKASIIIPGNIQVDLMTQDPGSYGALLQHFTGSKHHNIALREYALKKGYSLSEYGIKNSKNKKLNKVPTEEEFYNTLGMSYIPPELREDNGEIKAAIEDFNGKNPGLPKLVELEDVKSDLQIHSNFDIETSHDLGLSSYDDITNKAQELGYQYVAFTDHNPSRSKHTDSQILDLLKNKKESVEQYNYSLHKNVNRVFTVFNSLEIDIMSNGKLSIPESGFDYLDFALVSIHSVFRQSKAQMTSRVLSALNHPKAKIFAHPTARKLNEREGIELDWDKIFDFCSKNNKWIEVNADPMRLDLPDYLVKDAVKYGVKLTFGTDSHHIDQMLNMKYAVYVARRGWAQKRDIINTNSLNEFNKLLNL